MVGLLFSQFITIAAAYHQYHTLQMSGATHRLDRTDSHGGQGAALIPTKGPPTSTVVWMHGLGDTADGWLSGLPVQRFPSTKFVLPTASVKPVTLNGGYPMTAWFDLSSLEEDGPEDKAGFEESRARINAVCDNCNTCLMQKKEENKTNFSKKIVG